MRVPATVLTAALLAATPAVAASLYSYTLPAAGLYVGQRKVRVSVHPKEDSILVQASVTGGGAAGPPAKWPDAFWREAAEVVVAPLGCTIGEVTVLWKSGAAWEATYSCPEGVDLRAIYKAQRKQLEKGEPLKRLDPA